MAAPGAKPRSEQTREALLSAGLEIFGRDGFHAASTRAISEAAGVNQALIAYHFGGKEGLYHGVIRTITDNISQHMGPILDATREQVAGLDASTPEGRAACIACMDQIMGGAIELFGRPESKQWVKLVMREQQDPTAAFDIFYDGIYSEMMNLYTELAGKLSGAPASSEAVRVRALTLMGQVLVFVVGRGTVARLVGWESLGEHEREVLHQTVRQSLLALFEHEEPR